MRIGCRTIRRANRIAVLEDGRITAIGSHEELLTTSPTYQRLYQLQFMDMPEPEDSDSMTNHEPSIGIAADALGRGQRNSKYAYLFDDRICARAGARARSAQSTR